MRPSSVRSHFTAASKVSFKGNESMSLQCTENKNTWHCCNVLRDCGRHHKAKQYRKQPRSQWISIHSGSWFTGWISLRSAWKWLILFQDKLKQEGLCQPNTTVSLSHALQVVFANYRPTTSGPDLGIQTSIRWFTMKCSQFQDDESHWLWWSADFHSWVNCLNYCWRFWNEIRCRHSCSLQDNLK